MGPSPQRCSGPLLKADTLVAALPFLLQVPVAFFPKGLSESGLPGKSLVYKSSSSWTCAYSSPTGCHFGKSGAKLVPKRDPAAYHGWRYEPQNDVGRGSMPGHSG